MSKDSDSNYTVTPWKVSGKLDYPRLIKKFGLSQIDDKILRKIENSCGSLNFLLKRKMFIAHRDLELLLDKYEKGEKFFLYTGRGPSENLHLGHLVPMMFTKWLQKKFDTFLFIQMTDDEKFLFKNNLSLDEIRKYTYDNIIDILALGFDPEKTFFIVDTQIIKELYPIALAIAKKINFSNVKAVFGMTNESNIGQIFYTALQSVPAVLPSVWAGKNIPCLIPHGIDQDPHFRVSRDVLPRLGFLKPASIQSMMMPSLKQDGKMSASDPDSAIFLSDSPKDVKRKILRAFTGGRESADLQRKLGGNPDSCTVFDYYKFLFAPDDDEFLDIRKRCLKGEILCGEDKLLLIEKINSFLSYHRKNKEAAAKLIDKVVLTDENIYEVKEKVKNFFSN